ncbi:MAG: hypothetical protein Q8S33_17150 [Myxococcales bacterium]|nr:hypothetical protein [Myxococcales bacterium]
MAVASTQLADGGGVEHALIWGPQTPQSTWLYQPTQLTFFSVASARTVRFTLDGGVVEAAGAERFSWPDSVRSFSLERGRQGVFVLVEQRGGGCPGRHVEHWLQVRAGRVSELLTTGGTGEGGGEWPERWFEGSVAFWGGVPDDGESSPMSLSRFGPVVGVPLGEQVIVFDEQVEQGQLCRATRTTSRYRAGRLEPVRVETLVLDGGRPAVCGDPVERTMGGIRRR